MDGPECLRERFQARRKPFIGGNRICPHRIASERRNDYTAQHRNLRVCVNEGHVGVPTIGTGMTRVEFENRGASLARRSGWMESKFAKAQCEAFLTGVIEMPLIAEEDHFVF
jgi:hypothetical protein